MKQLAKIINPLAFNVPIVDPKTGYPTEYFKRILEDISDAKISASLIEALGGDPDENQVVTWDDTAGDLAFKPASDVLDMIGAEAHGDILHRGAAGWELLPAGTAGKVLTTNGAGADPTWETPSGGGGSLERTRVKPVVANFTLENAGTASISDGVNGLILSAPSSAVNTRFARLTSGPPASPYTITTRAAIQSPVNANTVHWNSIILRNSSNGRFVNFASTGQVLVSQRWSAYTVFNSAITSVNMADHSWTPWHRVINDGTTLTFQISNDGEDWYTFGATEALATYLTAAGGTVDQIGFAVINGAASSYTHETIFQSWEVT